MLLLFFNFNVLNLVNELLLYILLWIHSIYNKYISIENNIYFNLELFSFLWNQ